MAARKKTSRSTKRASSSRKSASSSKRTTANKAAYRSASESNQNILLLAAALVVAIGGYLFLKNQAANNTPPPPPAEAAKVMNVTLDAQNKSGQTGSATIKEVNGKAVVTVSLTPGAKGVAQPAHLHIGACPTPGDVKFPLNSVVDGKSETTLTVSYDEVVAAMPLALNVHKSTAMSKVYVACGDLEEPTY